MSAGAAAMAGVLSVSSRSDIAFVQRSPQVHYQPPGSLFSCPFSVPVTAGNDVLVYVTNYYGSGGGAPVTGVVVDGIAATLICTATDPSKDSTVDVWLARNCPGLSVDVFITTAGPDPYGIIRAEEFTNIGNVLQTYNGGAGATPKTYTALPRTGCLAVAIACDQSSAGPGHWLAPSGYTLALDSATFNVDNSGASAWRILPSTVGATVTWTSPNPITDGSQGLVLLEPS